MHTGLLGCFIERRRRIAALCSDSGPVPLLPGPKLALHMIPVVNEVMSPNISIGDVEDFQCFGSDQTCRKTYDAAGVYVADYGNGIAFGGYTYITRRGVVEAVTARFCHPPLWEANSLVAPARLVHRVVLKGVREYLNLIRPHGISHEIVVGVTLIGSRGVCLGTGGHRVESEVHPFSNDLLAFEPVLIDGNGELDSVLRPVFDQLWNAGGWDRCRDYRTDGTVDQGRQA